MQNNFELGACTTSEQFFGRKYGTKSAFTRARERPT